MTQPAAERIAELLGRFESSEDSSAWTEFLELYAPVLQQVVSLIETERDAAADCFVYICEHLAEARFRRLRRFRPDGSASFTTWLRAVARNLAIDWVRKTHGRSGAAVRAAISMEESGVLEQFIDPGPNPERAAAARERSSAVRRALERLPASAQVLLRLRFEQALTLEQVARLTGLRDAQTADRRLRQVLETLRREIGL